MSTNAIQLTEHFNVEEFKCHDETPVPAAYIPHVQELATNLEVLRTFFNKPIHVLSGYRTPEHNKAVGGAPHSQHLLAKAADITITSVSNKAIKAAIERLIKQGKMKQGGLGIYDGFVHYDIRGFKSRWDYTTV